MKKWISDNLIIACKTILATLTISQITKEGIAPPKQKQLLAAFKQVTVKEYGASSYLRAIAADIEESLRRHYPQEYKIRNFLCFLLSGFLNRLF